MIYHVLKNPFLGTKKKTRPKKRSGRKSAKSNNSASTSNTNGGAVSDSMSSKLNDTEITSSDSGTATDDQDQYLEIEGFPTVRFVFPRQLY